MVTETTPVKSMVDLDKPITSEVLDAPIEKEKLNNKDDFKVNEEVMVDGLGTCEILRIHDDGDLTIRCGSARYIVTPEGEVFKDIASAKEF
jgi:hypothetical protein